MDLGRFVCIFAPWAVDLRRFVQSRFGSVQPSPAALIRAAFNLSNLLVQNEMIPHPMDGGSFHGGLEEIRTPDPHNANVVRSQLRYKPIACGIAAGHIIVF